MSEEEKKGGCLQFIVILIVISAIMAYLSGGSFGEIFTSLLAIVGIAGAGIGLMAIGALIGAIIVGIIGAISCVLTGFIRDQHFDFDDAIGRAICGAFVGVGGAIALGVFAMLTGFEDTYHWFSISGAAVSGVIASFFME